MENYSNEKSSKLKPQNSFQINHLLRGTWAKTPETKPHHFGTQKNRTITRTKKVVADNISVYLFILLFQPTDVCLKSKNNIYIVILLSSQESASPVGWQLFSNYYQRTHTLFENLKEVLDIPLLKTPLLYWRENSQENSMSSGCVVNVLRAPQTCKSSAGIARPGR